MQDALTRGMNSAAGLDPAGVGIGIGQNEPRGPVRGPDPGQSAGASGSAQTVPSFLESWKSSLFHIDTESEFSAQVKQVSIRDRSTKAQPPAIAATSPSTRLQSAVGASPQPGSAIEASRWNLGVLTPPGLSDGNLSQKLRTILPVPIGGDPANKSKLPSRVAQSADEASSDRPRKIGKQELALGGASSAPAQAAALAIPQPAIPMPHDDAPRSPVYAALSEDESMGSDLAIQPGNASHAGSASRAARVQSSSGPVIGTASLKTRSVQSPPGQFPNASPTPAPQSPTHQIAATDDEDAGGLSSRAGMPEIGTGAVDLSSQEAKTGTVQLQQSHAARPGAAATVNDWAPTNSAEAGSVGAMSAPEPKAAPIGARAPAETRLHSEHGLANPSMARAVHATNPQGSHVMPVPSSLNPNLDPPRGVQAAIDGANSSKLDTAPASPGNTGSGAPDPFAALDAEGRAIAPAWTQAGSRQVEAGFQDPALGWVGVRAQADTTGIHASLVPGTADAAQALGSHLTGLNDYLAQHEAHIQTVTLSAPEGYSAGLGAHQGGGQSAGQGTNQGGYSAPQAHAESGTPSVGTTAGRETAPAGNQPDGMPGGVYISVMA